MKNKNKNNIIKNIGGNIIIWVLIVAMSITALQILSSDKNPIPVDYSEYLNLLESGKIKSVFY